MCWIKTVSLALLNFNFHQSSNMRISAAFDVDKSRAGTIMAGVPIYSMTELKEQITAQRINIAILTVPQGVAQEITNELVDAGIKGILNFTPLRVTVPSGVRVQNVDLTNELQTLVYFIENYGSITTG